MQLNSATWADGLRISLLLPVPVPGLVSSRRWQDLEVSLGQGCCGASVFGSGIPRAEWACWLWASATWLGEQKSSRNIWAKFRSLVLAEREKRSMHWTTGREVSSGWARVPGELRYMSVVTADNTVSSLGLDRQLTMSGTPPVCRICSLLALSGHRLQSPPGERQ